MEVLNLISRDWPTPKLVPNNLGKKRVVSKSKKGTSNTNECRVDVKTDKKCMAVDKI